jgi:hypothetical protein
MKRSYGVVVSFDWIAAKAHVQSIGVGFHNYMCLRLVKS